jgi:predicted PurR-regulated permease PerM
MAGSSQVPSWSRDTKRVVVVVVLLTAVALVYLARSVLSLVALSAVLAYVFQPLVDSLARRGVSRGIAAALSVVLLVVLVALAPLLLLPVLIEQVGEIATTLSELPDLFQAWVPAYLEQRPVLEVFGARLDVAPTIEEIRRLVLEAAGDVQMPSLMELTSYVLQGVRTAGGVLGTAAGIATGVVSAVAAAVLGVVLVLMYTFYLTKDGPDSRSWVQKIVTPEFWPEIDELMRRISLTWRAFFRGQIILSISIGFVTFVTTALLGLPGALVLGILAGVLEVVPNLGPVLAAIPAVLLALIQGSRFLPVENWVFALIVVGLYALIQQVENNLFVPRIMGQSLDLHPMIVLVGVVVGTATAGILGAFLAAPLLASLKVLGMYAHAKLTDQVPFQKPALPEAPDVVAGRKSWLNRLQARLQGKNGGNGQQEPGEAFEETEPKLVAEDRTDSSSTTA